MESFKHILFPVDFSEACRSFAPIVRSVACRTGAHLTLLNTLELPSSFESSPKVFTSLVDLRELMRRQKSDFAAFLKGHFTGLPGVNHVCRRGDPARRVLEYTQKHEVDLIMLPTHGLGMLRRMLIGSMTAKVLHDATCPVWTNAHQPEGPPSPRLAKILCPLDLDEDNIDLMHYAQGLARTFGSQLRFLNVVNVGESWTVRQFEADFVARLVREARSKLQELEDSVDVHGEFEVRSGDIAHAVRREALEWKADLVVIGRGVLGRPLGSIRSDTFKIIRESPCAVVSVVTH